MQTYLMQPTETVTPEPFPEVFQDLEDEEEWRLVVNNPKYEVSSHGNVRSAKTKEMKSANVNTSNGRRMTSIYKKQFKTSKTTLIARLVAEAFLGPRPPGMQIDHKDGNKLNDAASNLWYVEQSINVQRAYDMGLHPNRPSHGYLTEEDYAEIKRLFGSGVNQKEIARRFTAAGTPITNSAVSRIVNGKTNPVRRKDPNFKRALISAGVVARIDLAGKIMDAEPKIGIRRMARLLNVSRPTARRTMQSVRARRGVV